MSVPDQLPAELWGMVVKTVYDSSPETTRILVQTSPLFKCFVDSTIEKIATQFENENKPVTASTPEEADKIIELNGGMANLSDIEITMSTPSNPFAAQQFSSTISTLQTFLSPVIQSGVRQETIHLSFRKMPSTCIDPSLDLYTFTVLLDRFIRMRDIRLARLLIDLSDAAADSEKATAVINRLYVPFQRYSNEKLREQDKERHSGLNAVELASAIRGKPFLEVDTEDRTLLDKNRLTVNDMFMTRAIMFFTTLYPLSVHENIPRVAPALIALISWFDGKFSTDDRVLKSILTVCARGGYDQETLLVTEVLKLLSHDDLDSYETLYTILGFGIVPWAEIVLANFSMYIDSRRAEKILTDAGITRATNTMLQLLTTVSDYLATYPMTYDDQNGDGEESEDEDVDDDEQVNDGEY